MTIKTIKDGAVREVSDGYGLRMIEQGKAVPSPSAATKPPRRRADAARK